MATLPSGTSLAAAVAARQGEIVGRLRLLDEDELLGGSRLPGWDRLTIVCHLRYGAVASGRMTADALDGRPTSFYPRGRHQQRPATLRPGDGESAADVLSSLDEECGSLDELWAGVDGDRWLTPIHEPPGNTDLGSITLWMLVLLRLTEVEVHGHDLDLDLSPWSAAFVAAALPTRLRWLTVRRSNHQAIGHSVNGSWALAGLGGPTLLVQAQGGRVEVRETESDSEADVVLAGTPHQLLAFILGREPLEHLQVRGDVDLAHSFLDAFPPP